MKIEYTLNKASISCSYLVVSQRILRYDYIYNNGSLPTPIRITLYCIMKPYFPISMINRV